MTGPSVRVALDTSAAVALLSASHPAHRVAIRALAGRVPVLTGHSLAETYSVLTRLPGDARVTPADVVSIFDDTFGPPVCLSPDRASDVPRHLADRQVAGGAVYDALVGLAAAEADLTLLTRDARAATTYRSIGVRFELVDD